MRILAGMVLLGMVVIGQMAWAYDDGATYAPEDIENAIRLLELDQEAINMAQETCDMTEGLLTKECQISDKMKREHALMLEAFQERLQEETTLDDLIP